MKIITCTGTPLKVPLNKPMRTRYVTFECVECLLLTITTDSNISGQGLVFGAGKNALNVFQHYINNVFVPQIIGRNPLEISEIWHALWVADRNRLQTGFALYALAAIDIALWDIKAKFENKTLRKLLGVSDDKIPLYGNGGWLNYSDDELIADCEWYLQRGVDNFKIRIGSDRDELRLKLLRKTFSDSLNIAVDANQHYDLVSAKEVSKMLANYDVQWFEEPLFSNSVTELAELAECSPVPIASGENVSSHWQIEDMCKLNAATTIQPDVIHCGGISEFIRIADVVSRYDLILSAHLFAELSLSLAGLSKKPMLEHVDFFADDLFEHDFSIKDGYINPNFASGHGIVVTEAAIKKYQI